MMTVGVYVNNHVVYGDCEIILREHWSWDTHGWITKFKHSSNWLPQDGFPHNKLTSYKIPSGGHGQCKVTTYSNGDYGGSSTVLQNGWVPERGTY